MVTMDDEHTRSKAEGGNFSGRQLATWGYAFFAALSEVASSQGDRAAGGRSSASELLCGTVSGYGVCVDGIQSSLAALAPQLRHFGHVPKKNMIEPAASAQQRCDVGGVNGASGELAMSVEAMALWVQRVAGEKQIP